ncbi:unnamed protein product [Diatraea saccharalis]|uniref:C-type lectin domain-containing protein n=1 Tax=Diatraea saccharalis TaxID=40085 RepID=A0A9N9RDN0_9NEOP|nr:unnamed protein product [Diatraea saccharalis]
MFCKNTGNVPKTCTNRWESYVFNDKEYIVHNLPVNWDNAKILCRGHHNGTLAVLDTKDKSEFLAEALSESQFLIESVWIAARRASADDPAGYRWRNGVELRRTAADILANTETDGDARKHFPMRQENSEAKRVLAIGQTLDSSPRVHGSALRKENAVHLLPRSVPFSLECPISKMFSGCKMPNSQNIQIPKIPLFPTCPIPKMSNLI